MILNMNGLFTESQIHISINQIRTGCKDALERRASLPAVRDKVIFCIDANKSAHLQIIKKGTFFNRFQHSVYERDDFARKELNVFLLRNRRIARTKLRNLCIIISSKQLMNNNSEICKQQCQLKYYVPHSVQRRLDPLNQRDRKRLR